jgi:hypothetical protein
VRSGSWAAALAGFAAGTAAASRPADLPLVVALLAAVALRGGLRNGLIAVALAVLPIGLDALYRIAMFGGPLATGYGAEAIVGWRRPIPDGVVGLLGLLVSPGRGILLWSPLLGPALARLLWSDGADPDRRVLRAFGLGVVAHVLLMSCWHSWDGGWSLGPRMLSDELPFLAVGLARARTRRIILATLAGWSIAANVLVTYAPNPRALASVRELSLGPWSPLAHPFVAYPFALAKAAPP